MLDKQSWATFPKGDSKSMRRTAGSAQSLIIAPTKTRVMSNAIEKPTLKVITIREKNHQPEQKDYEIILPTFIEIL